MSDRSAALLRSKAQLARRVADAIGDAEASNALREMADELELEAKRIEGRSEQQG